MTKKLLPLLLIALLPLCGCSKSAPPEAASYAQEHWAQYAPFLYDPAETQLFMTMHSTMDYETACARGGSVYSGELAPESYLDTVRIVALEIASACDLQKLNVTMQCISSDEKTVFSVSSDGAVWCCWD